MLELEELRLILIELGLSRSAEILESKLTSATEANYSYLAFGKDLLSHELSTRRERAFEVRMRTAGLPSKKRISDFDFSFCPSLDKAVIDGLCSLAFVATSSNVVLLGPPGVGKSHIAIGLGMEAIIGGYSVYFTTLSKIADDLSYGTSGARFRKYITPKVLIIDEIGYRAIDHVASNVFFEVISARYETGSIILTSNKGFGEWSEIFPDVIQATAILDRLLHHCTVINIKGNSYRLRDRVAQGIYTSPQAAAAHRQGEVVTSER
ncbi:IS21-like element helper ATPase IstB [Acidithrix ferrooxidans]|uniref:Transposase n=1 Tax=Acidithrix ferrooxidans TaxID=1280514 RepID=A0A0D8HNS6_9ACTN|nr:IS21-like element helper ATPase IstB [Acidithrix ferrooxidans]KJF18786.1 transposase [Acidithrix ferrooxidans]